MQINFYKYYYDKQNTRKEQKYGGGGKKGPGDQSRAGNQHGATDQRGSDIEPRWSRWRWRAPGWCQHRWSSGWSWVSQEIMTISAERRARAELEAVKTLMGLGLEMGNFGNFLFRLSIGLKNDESSTRGPGHGRNGNNENVWRLLLFKIKIWHENLSMKTWILLDYDYDAAMLFKIEASKAAWSEAEEWLYPNKLKPVLWHILWY